MFSTFPFNNPGFQSFAWGVISAISLPLGTLTILVWKPGPKAVAFLMAFGGGALLSALTIDLVGAAIKAGHFIPLAIGCAGGGVLFEVLNQLLNKQGGFLRKSSTTLNYLKIKKSRQFKRIFRELSRIPIFHELPPEEIKLLAPYITDSRYPKGVSIFKQGEKGDSLFIIEKGIVDVWDDKSKKRISRLTDNDIVGEIAIITGATRTATARTVTDTNMWVIQKTDFEKVLAQSPRLSQVMKDLIQGRLKRLEKVMAIDPKKARRWAATVIRNIDERAMLPTNHEIQKAAAENKGAPLAIWLGILLDGIPESLVIGASLIHSSISFSLIAGLFLSNYPEALSSSMGMKEQGKSFPRILLMWSSLVLITGIGAFFGNMLFAHTPHFLFAFIEGLAAGAMLTMIAETMLPEAFHKGGSIIGLATLFGFLSALFFKMI
ncbi:MAG: cyclic nucleotide-binding domain-containing protein [Spirochaetota bacterium]